MHTPSRRKVEGFSILELMIVVAIIGILTAIAVPNFLVMQARAKRSEIPSNVSGIWVAEIAFDAIEDRYVSMSQNPSSTPSKSPRAFDPAGTGWEDIGWKPDGLVRGSYSVDAGTSTFTVYGIGDTDGDGVMCQYTASESQAPILRTGDESVY